MNGKIQCVACDSYEIGIRFTRGESATVYWLECGDCGERVDTAFVEQYPNEQELSQSA